MKKIFKYIFIPVLFFLAISCNDDFLNPPPEDRFGEAAVWQDPALTEAFVNEMYRGLNHGLRELMLGSLADESQFIHNYGSAQVVQSNLTSGDVGSFTRGDFAEFNWTELYRRIRQVNLFMENIDKVPFGDNEYLRNRLLGEVHFLNAYFYHNLVRLHGGVPIVQRTFGLEDDFLVERNSLEECVQYIVEQADLAASLLPLTYDAGNNEIGRATKGAALALKSRMLLYAASDLYNNPGWTEGYDHPELIAITSGSREEKWQAAKDAAKAVMDLGIYQLHDTEKPAFEDYTELFLSPTTQEAIFSRYFVKSRGWEDGALPGLANGPNGYHNWGGNTPIQELVDDYEMVDGTEFDWSNPEHAAAPYENRDPRFYATILYDQALWRPRPSDTREIDPVGKIMIRSVETAPGVFTPGLDTRDGPVEDWNGGYSGYYLRKFIDPTIEHEYAAAGGNQEAPWHFFRYGEIILNYAEACLGLGQEEEARTYINMIRERADMPLITDTGQDLVERYRNERRVELAFEQHRYFDVRRWMIAPEVLDRDAQGIVIVEPLDGEVEYSLNTVQERAWNDRMYFLPIILDELNRNPNLVQNPGY